MIRRRINQAKEKAGQVEEGIPTRPTGLHFLFCIIFISGLRPYLNQEEVLLAIRGHLENFYTVRTER